MVKKLSFHFFWSQKRGEKPFRPMDVENPAKAFKIKHGWKGLLSGAGGPRWWSADCVIHSYEVGTSSLCWTLETWKNFLEGNTFSIDFERNVLSTSYQRVDRPELMLSGDPKTFLNCLERHGTSTNSSSWQMYMFLISSPFQMFQGIKLKRWCHTSARLFLLDPGIAICVCCFGFRLGSQNVEKLLLLVLIKAKWSTFHVGFFNSAPVWSFDVWVVSHTRPGWPTRHTRDVTPKRRPVPSSANSRKLNMSRVVQTDDSWTFLGLRPRSFLSVCILIPWTSWYS